MQVTAYGQMEQINLKLDAVTYNRLKDTCREKALKQQYLCEILIKTGIDLIMNIDTIDLLDAQKRLKDKKLSLGKTLAQMLLFWLKKDRQTLIETLITQGIAKREAEAGQLVKPDQTAPEPPNQGN